MRQKMKKSLAPIFSDDSGSHARNPISGTWSTTSSDTSSSMYRPIFAKVVNHKLFLAAKWAPILYWVIYSILFRKLHHGIIISIVYFIWLWYGECGTNMIIDGKALGIYLFTIFGLTLSTLKDKYVIDIYRALHIKNVHNKKKNNRNICLVFPTCFEKKHTTWWSINIFQKTYTTTCRSLFDALKYY